MNTTEVEIVKEIATRIGLAIWQPIFFSVIESNSVADPNTKDFYHGWMGETGGLKHREESVFNVVETNFATREHAEDLTFGPEGGIRKGSTSISVSSDFSPRINFILEKVLLWRRYNEAKLHHVSLSYSSQRVMMDHLAKDEKRLESSYTAKVVKDQKRYYIAVPQRTKGIFLLEYSVAEKDSIQLSFTTPASPGKMKNFIVNAIPETMEPIPHGSDTKENTAYAYAYCDKQELYVFASIADTFSSHPEDW